METLSIVPLHDHPEFLEPCALLLNSEWKRSLEARLHTLRKCSNKFPVSLVLLEESARGQGRMQILGHSRLTFIPGIPGACFVESVVVDKNCRGRGYGRVLMDKTEEYIKGRGFSELYLTTTDADQFYKKLGYGYCKPIATAGAFAQDDPRMAQFLKRMAASNAEQDERTPALENSTRCHAAVLSLEKAAADPFDEPVPVPPPAPPSSWQPKIEHHPNLTVHYMRKIL